MHYIIYYNFLKRGEKMTKQKIGIIKGLDLYSKTKGRQIPVFRTGKHQTEKDRPRDKNWRKWI